MKTSESIANIAAALVQFQAEVSNPEKKGVNPHFKSKYAELDEIINTIRPTLEKFGLAFIQNPVHEESKVGVYTMILHKSGEFIQFDPVMIPLQKPTPHQVGSSLTYAKRYSLGAALGLATEEDKDGNDIVNQPKQQAQQKQQQPKMDRKTKGIMAVHGEVKAKHLTKAEFEAILIAEVGKKDIKDLSVDELGSLYKVLHGNTSDELKETARAHMMLQQQSAGVA